MLHHSSTVQNVSPISFSNAQLIVSLAGETVKNSCGDPQVVKPDRNRSSVISLPVLMSLYDERLARLHPGVLTCH